MYYEAAEIWLKTDIKEKEEKAGLNYELAQKWELAEECWRRIPRWDKIALCCEKQGDQKVDLAIEAWLNAGNKLKAANLLRRTGRWKQAAGVLTGIKDK